MIEPAEELPRWHVMRAYKAEKAAEEWLSGTEMRYFIAKQWAVREYHGRKGRYMVPAIPGIIFIKATRDELAKAKLSMPRLQYVMDRAVTPPEPLTVPERQMENFITVASRALDTESVEFLLPDEQMPAAGTQVRIHGGPFDGVVGTFRRVKGHRNRRLVVELPGLGAVSAEVKPDLVEVIQQSDKF